MSTRKQRIWFCIGLTLLCLGAGTIGTHDSPAPLFMGIGGIILGIVIPLPSRTPKHEA